MTLQTTARTAASVATPPAGVNDLFTDSADQLMKYRDPSGNLHILSGEGMSQFYDVTNYGVLTSNSASANVTAMNALLALAPNGSTIYFPGGVFKFNAAWTMPTASSFIFQGVGSNRAGSPATAYTEIQLTAILAGTFITLASGQWYYQFFDLTFTTTVVQSAGYCIDVNGNVGCNFRGVAIQANGGTWFNCINFGGTNGGNQTVVDGCNLSGFTNYGINVNSSGSSLIITSSIIQGIWGTATQVAAAGVSALACGALQIANCDILGSVNNLLLQPTTGLVCASVYCVNTYFDNSSGSCVLITGAGATVRTKFVGCSFTCSSSGAGSYSAVQVAGTFTYTVAAAQGIDLIGCTILNTFGATGTINGVLCTNAADILIKGCRIAGWTNGIQITPITSVSAPVIENNIIGSNGGYGVNTVGILLNAGTYSSQTIIDNNLMNNTTAITDNTTVTTTANNNRLIKNNQGFNPKSTVAQPAVPATTVAVFNSTGVDCTVWVKEATPADLTVITVGGVAITTEVAAAGVAMPVLVAANQSIAMTFTAAPTWTWIGT